MDKILVLIGSAGLIGFIVWWFFGQKGGQAMQAQLTDAGQEVEVVVNGGYVPNTVVLQKGVPARVVFDRQDASGCFDEVVFPDFGIKQRLPVGQLFPIEIDTSEAGEYQYACGMNMFFGKVVVK